jgi:hypothetical protein
MPERDGRAAREPRGQRAHGRCRTAIVNGPGRSARSAWPHTPRRRAP